MTYSLASLGRAIEVSRVAAGLTQVALGVAAGYSPKGAGVSISRVESGAMRPKDDTLSGIAETLGTTVLELEVEAAQFDREAGILEVAEPRPVKQRLSNLQRASDDRTERAEQLADSFVDAHDRARDAFFLPFVTHAALVRNARLPPSPDELRNRLEPGADVGAAFRVEVATSTLAATLAGTAAEGIAGGAAAGAAGAAAGGAAAYATYTATAALGTASTGVPIAGLTGIARTNATLAALGRGSIAAGGAGIAGGKLLLTSMVVAPAVIAVFGGALWLTTRRNKQKTRELTERLDLAEHEMADTQPGFEALMDTLADATRVFDYIGTHAGHAEQRWATCISADGVESEDLDPASQARYQDFLNIAGCQLAVAGIDAGAFMVNRGPDLEALTTSAREVLEHAQRTVAELV